MSLMSLALLGWSFTTSATWEAQGVAKKSKQLSGSFLLRIRWVWVLILCLSAYLLISFSCILWNSQLCAYPGSLFLGCRGKMPKDEISLRCSRSSWWMFIEWMGKYPRKISKNKFFWDNRVQFSSIQSLSLVWLFVTPWTTTCQVPCPLPTPGVYPNSCPLSWWCHQTISFSVVPFSSCPQSLPASGSFRMSQFFSSGGQSFVVSASASVLPMNTQDWSPLGWTSWISF